MGVHYGMKNLSTHFWTGRPGLAGRLGNLLFAVAVILIYLLGQQYQKTPQEPAAASQEQSNILLTSPMADDIVGFNGPTPARIELDPATGRITVIEFLPNAEDPPFWKRFADSEILKRYLGKTPAEAAALEIDAVSGATYSSTAAQETLRKRLQAVTGTIAPRPESGFAVSWTDILAAAVILLNLILFLRPANPRRKMVMDAVNLLVLGFLTYNFLSAAQILGWAGTVPHWRLSIPLILFAVVLLWAVLSGRNIYCTGLCPYGCAQDLAFQLGRKCGVKPAKAAFRYGPYIRRIVLGVLVLALLCGIKMVQVEPFGAFTLHAPWYILLGAAGFVGIAMFLPRLWCRWFCPCGALVDFFRKTEAKKELSKGGKTMTFERILILALLLITVIVLVRPPQVRPEVPAANSGNDVLSVIHERKSVRHYTADPVSPEDLDKLVRAGFAAPTARNSQPWEFIVITDRKRLDQLAEGLPYGKMLAKAPAAIAVCGNSADFMEGEARDMWIQDCSAATQNILLAAEGLKLGAVWLGVLPLKERMADVSKVLGLPSGIIPLCVISIGHPTGVEKPKDKYKPAKVHFQGWK